MESNIKKYEQFKLKIPVESDDYFESSSTVINYIESIMKNAIDKGENKILINTNLKLGLPMENINKIAGPFVEAWAFQTFYNIFENPENEYFLINVEAQERLNMADVILQFKKKSSSSSFITANIDVKATAEDIESSGKSPNITSFSRIRTAYIEDPDYMFIVLSLKHKVSSERDKSTKLMNGIMEIVKYNVYDLKLLSDSDISYNPALGTGQLQIRDIHYVTVKNRSTWEFCQMLDKKFILSKKGLKEWKYLAKKEGWIK